MLLKTGNPDQTRPVLVEKLVHVFARRFFARIALAAVAAVLFCVGALAQTPVEPPFRSGEKLTYNFSLGKFKNVAFAESYVVSKGKLNGADAFELQMSFRTLSFASAAFFLVDQTRTTFASVETGLPLYSKTVVSSTGLPKETSVDHTKLPVANYDLVTLIYAIRRDPSRGSLTLVEGGKLYPVTFQVTGGESVETEVGEVATQTVSVQTELLTELGISDFRMDLSADADRIPARIRFRTDKGEVTALLASKQVIGPKPTPTPIATPEATPTPVVTPTPVPTPLPYVDNQPLSPFLSFDLGETLVFAVKDGDREIGAITFRAETRRQYKGVDSLLLTMTVTEASPGQTVLIPNDYYRAWVDPVTLIPREVEARFAGLLGGLNYTAVFDNDRGQITLVGSTPQSTPVGTHSVLSLFYAMRSFNLRPTRDGSILENDTRVAVFWKSGTTVFSLRPSDVDLVNLAGEKVPAQLVTIVTNNPELDALAPKVWLGTRDRRLPQRISLGRYTLDLRTSLIIPPQ